MLLVSAPTLLARRAFTVPAARSFSTTRITMTGAIQKLVAGDWGYSHDEIPDLSGKVAMVTGASGGIGFVITRELARHNAKVIAVGKPTDIEEGKRAMAVDGETTFNNSTTTGLGAKAAANIQWEAVEQSELKDVLRFAKQMEGSLDRLDLLIENAGLGVMDTNLTPDGYDSHLTVNNLAHMLLANRLLPLMRKTSTMDGVKAGDVRIVGQSSELHRGDKAQDAMFENEEEFKQLIGPMMNYARSKAAVILFGKGLVKNAVSDSIRVYATHPGAVATGQADMAETGYGLLGKATAAMQKATARTPDHGSLCALWAAVAPDALDYRNGSYFTDPKEEGKEIKEADEERRVDNFWRVGQEVVKKVAGNEALIDWKQGA